MTQTEVYLGLGGNVGDTRSVFSRFLHVISCEPGISWVEVSSLYETEPWQVPPQRCFLNAVCRLHTTLVVSEFVRVVQRIEGELGKSPKPKESPRVLDVDVLFFGRELYRTADWEIPHPRWRERLFVLAPLADLIQRIAVPTSGSGPIEMVNVRELMTAFSPLPNEWVRPAEWVT